MKQNTPIQELIPALRQWNKQWAEYDNGLTAIKKPQNIDDFLKPYLEKEKQMVIDAVNETIDAYNFYTESPHNPPPMNGQDYFNNKYNTK